MRVFASSPVSQHSVPVYVSEVQEGGEGRGAGGGGTKL